MVSHYSNTEREKIRKTFAKNRRQNCSIMESCSTAGISTSTYYAWNHDDKWKKQNGWDKDDGWDK